MAGILYLSRDWFEDELRAFQGGKDGLVPCVWENEVSSFPQVRKYTFHFCLCGIRSITVNLPKSMVWMIIFS